MQKTNTLFLLFIVLTIPLGKVKSQLLPLTQWHYIEVDNTKGKWGDFDKPVWLRYFGVDAGDLNKNGYRDIVSGRYFYRNPGGDMTGKRERIDLGLNVDVISMPDVDGGEFGDIIAQALPKVYWMETLDKAGNSWEVTRIATIPATGHVNSQGFSWQAPLLNIWLNQQN